MSDYHHKNARCRWGRARASSAMQIRIGSESARLYLKVPERDRRRFVLFAFKSSLQPFLAKTAEAVPPERP